MKKKKKKKKKKKHTQKNNKKNTTTTKNEVNKNDKYPQPDLNQGCPDWKAGVLTTTQTVLTFIHIGKRALFTIVTEEYLCQVQICKQKVLINITSWLLVCLFAT